MKRAKRKKLREVRLRSLIKYVRVSISERMKPFIGKIIDAEEKSKIMGMLGQIIDEIIPPPILYFETTVKAEDHMISASIIARTKKEES